MVSSFLLVFLNVDAILGEITLHRRRKKLDEMTKGDGLGGAYAATLSRMKAQHGSRSKLGMEVLMWVLHAERPLHVDELCQALGVEEGSVDLNIRNIPAVETLLACSLGLITVEKSSSTVRLVHYTLKEYLSHNPNLFLSPHSLIAEVCLTYLNFRHIRDLSPTIRYTPPAAPFVEYASCYWGVHARRETTESVKLLALELLDGYDKHISSKIMILCEMNFWEKPLDQEDIPRGFTGLHGAACLGCVEIVITLLGANKWDVQAPDFHGNTALWWAARRGHEGVVSVLLDRSDINPNIVATRYGGTPLTWAAESGNEGVVRLLLERSDINPNIVDARYGQTPLTWAAENEHEGVVRVLLGRSDVNPDIADTQCGRTPLTRAAENGHEGVVRLLLERSDINLNIVDARYGRTPLTWAAENDHERVVRVLLGQSDVNPNIEDTQCGLGCQGWAIGGRKDTAGTGRRQYQYCRHQVWPNTALVGYYEWA